MRFEFAAKYELEPATPLRMTVPPAVSLEPGFSPPAHIILRLASTGIIAIASRSSHARLPSPPSAYPYPPTLERALNLLCWAALRAGAPLPKSAPDLLRWCRERPLRDWPIEIPAELGGPDELLIEGGLPTVACLELSLPGSGELAEADLFERTFISQLLSQCQGLRRPDLYREMRRLLIERPVLNAYDREALRLNPNLRAVWPLIDAAYLEAPLETIFDGRRLICSGCGNLLVQDSGGEPSCVDKRCPNHLGPKTQPRQLEEHGACYWLRFDLRAFVSAPGRFELALARQLAKSGGTVELWPEFDTYDIAVKLKSGERWAIDAKDWSNPFRLAAALKPISPDPPWDRAFIVVPDDRVAANRGYLNAVRQYSSGVIGGPVGLVTAKQLLRLMKTARH